MGICDPFTKLEAPPLIRNVSPFYLKSTWTTSSSSSSTLTVANGSSSTSKLAMICNWSAIASTLIFHQSVCTLSSPVTTSRFVSTNALNAHWCETSSWINRSFLVEKSTGGNCSMRMLKQKCLAAVSFDPTTFGLLCTVPSLCMIHDVWSRVLLWAQHASSAPRSILHSLHWHLLVFIMPLRREHTKCQLYL